MNKFRVITRTFPNGNEVYSVVNHGQDIGGASRHFGQEAMYVEEVWMVDEWDTIMLYHKGGQTHGKLPRPMIGME